MEYSIAVHAFPNYVQRNLLIPFFAFDLISIPFHSIPFHFISFHFYFAFRQKVLLADRREARLCQFENLPLLINQPEVQPTVRLQTQILYRREIQLWVQPTVRSRIRPIIRRVVPPTVRPLLLQSHLLMVHQPIQVRLQCSFVMG